MPLLMQYCITQNVVVRYRVPACVNHMCTNINIGCDGLDMSVGNINKLNVCWNDVYREVFGFHR